MPLPVARAGEEAADEDVPGDDRRAGVRRDRGRVQRVATPHGAVRPERDEDRWTRAGAVPGGERAIRSPMPGKVLAVNVAPADAVDTDTVLLVLEAMKMENDILAPAEGTVKSIHVRPGATVNTGDVMMVIE